MAILKNTTVNDTGHITLPVGTTAQRPSNAKGIMRYNSSLSTIESYNENESWTGLITSGLRIQLDANNSSSYGGSGTTWTDLSGNGYNFTWNSSPTFRTSSGQSWFECLGNRADGPASNGVGITNTSGYTILMLCRTGDAAAETPGVSTQNNAGFKFHKNNQGGSTRGISIHPAWGGSNIYFDQGGCCDDGQRIFTSVSIVPDLQKSIYNWTLWGYRSTIGTRSIFRNGREIVGTNVRAVDVNFNSTAIHLGGSDEYGGTASNWDGKLNLFLVYNRGLTDSEMFQLFKFYRSRVVE